ncbi:TetR/AcrR family transcriptional regulator [Isoptericola sp. 4D.3]|uniref:TetR/AcrR family transcriptional regulator n=1 Tax=Isoptericola peretonis TaxID=2918523 RepID=A0ABT0J8S7_9MICO|nr:TetR/AcrR family transcriptional regulator [Isoptericola sp. 4D.3]
MTSADDRSDADVDGRAPRRQARGQRRIEEILDAAGRVFVREGYDAATTNAVAKEAGISPGSLYQYFRNKDEIAQGLAVRYAAGLAELQRAAFDGVDPQGLSLEDLVRRVIDPVVAFNVAHPAFKTLFARTDPPPGLAEATAPLDASIHERAAALVAARAPQLAPADAARVSVVATQLVRAMMPLVVAASGAERERLAAEARSAVAAYLRVALG